MQEEHIFFYSGDLRLEALFAKGDTEKGVVVTHPHPLYGGDMYNNVVAAIVTAYQDSGYTTLRFNFRGVGGSHGTHDEGRGEQEDVKAALAYLKSKGIQDLHLGGYSFGAWVNALALNQFSDDIATMVMVSPPVAFLDFSFLKYSEKIKLIISGERDDIAPPSIIKPMKDTWNPGAAFYVIEGADHFYWGKEKEIIKMIKEYLQRD